MNENRTGVMCNISPSVFIDNVEFTRVILFNRFGKDTLSKKEFPVFVYITIPKNESIFQKDKIHSEEIINIAWGEMYESSQDAENQSL